MVKKRVNFDHNKLELYKSVIDKFYENIDQRFITGWPFTNFGYDKDRDIWTRSVQDQEQLLYLGIALKKAKYTYKPEIWKLFSGGLPFITVNK